MYDAPAEETGVGEEEGGEARVLAFEAEDGQVAVEFAGDDVGCEEGEEGEDEGGEVGHGEWAWLGVLGGGGGGRIRDSC